ncbi:hypothetical protein [Streptomyces niveus]|uniref:hypothetical protein n=1 Tax=Streptomyces niveus TaxID=193462 RepID=UPI00341C5335
MAEAGVKGLSDAKLRGLRAAVTDRLGMLPVGTPVATTNSLRDAGLALGRDGCGHLIGDGHRHSPIRTFVTVAGRDAVGAAHPPRLTAAGTELELQCVRDLEAAGYSEGFTVVEVEPGGVRIEMAGQAADEPDTWLLGLYANGWRPLKDDDTAGLYPVPLVPAGESGAGAGMCRQCGRGLMYDESGRCLTDEYGEYLCVSAKDPVSPTHVLLTL